MSAQQQPEHDDDTFEMEILDATDFHAALAAQLDVSRKLQVSCAMLLLQVEYEDIYLERYGVDDVNRLRNPFAYLVGQSIRDSDTVGWLYDGCLAVILRIVSAEETSLVATRLQKVLARHPVLIGGLNLHLAVQVGGVWYSGLRPMKPEDFTLQAIQALSS